jgi:hypothetical protein
MYTSTAQKAATIRQALKNELGFNSRQVSVRCGAGGGAIRVEVLAPVGDKFPRIKKIAGEQESVRYCERSGEILSGGNTFVHASFSSEMVEAEARNFYAWLEAIPVTVKGEREYVHDSGVCDEFSKIFVGRTENGFTWKGMTWHRDQIARSIATYKLTAGPAEIEEEDDAETLLLQAMAAAGSRGEDAYATGNSNTPALDIEALRPMLEAHEGNELEILGSWMRGWDRAQRAAVAPEVAAALAPAGCYAIKCDDCRKEIGRTDSVPVSAAGGHCAECKATTDARNQASGNLPPAVQAPAFSTVTSDSEELLILGIRSALAVGWSGASSKVVERFH